MEDRIFEWAETKREIFVLARAASETISEAADEIFERCSQKVNTTFFYEVGDAEATVHNCGFDLSGHAPDKALSSHWTGRLEDWKKIADELKRLQDRKYTLAKLAERL